MSFIQELKRRNVFKVGIAYVLMGWVLLQGVDFVLDLIDAPNWVVQVFVLAVVLGLPFALFFAWAFEMTPEGLKKEKDVNRTESITQQTGRKLDFMIIGVLVIGIGYLLLDKFMLDPARDAQNAEVAAAAIQTAEPEAAVAPVEEVSAKSIAVLPFVNMSEDTSNEYFSDGISEEILNSLASVKELKVAGRTSSFAFKGQNQDLRQIGDALGVKHILEGSVRKAGNKVRITAQLVQVDEGFHLWSDTYDRELTDVFEIQDEIAGAILDQLKAHLLDEDVAVATATRTDSEAYDKFLLARQRMYDRNRLSLEAAVSFLNAAIAEDPNYAPAYALRGISNLLLRERQYGTLSPEQSDRLGKQDIDKALALDPELAEAWAGLGLYHQDRVGEHNQAIEALEKALSINPNLMDASNWLQISYGNAGQPEKVLAIIEDMVRRDPLYRPAIGNAILEYNRRGWFEKSLALIDRVRPYISHDPMLLSLESRVYNFQGLYSKSLPMAEEAWRQAPDDGIFEVGVGFNLWALHEYERLAELSPPFIKIYAMDKLERTEEATILAIERAAEGEIGALFALYSRKGRYADLVKFLEDRWDSLDEFQAVYPQGTFGYRLMSHVAHAYAQTGNDERYRDAMARVEEAHEKLITVGIDNLYVDWNMAIHHVLAGDHDAAIARLEIAVNRGAIGDLRISDGDPEFKPLEGDPRYEAIQARMIENLNTQRAELGLGPATI